jgi:UDP-3-O-[3-hydroxymyristoyl] glucosamine N-acyltransferase
VTNRAAIFEDKIGASRPILEGNTIQPFTKFGNDGVLWTGNRIGRHGTIQGHLTFMSHVVMSGQCDIGSYGFVGLNSTLRDGLKMAEAKFAARHPAPCKIPNIVRSAKGSRTPSPMCEA